ncbi:LytR C-terminal domain-containing protein [Patescibacteria group bacterium]|nr:LytR C-terminal domain-containing protein [Patescibacteria group bacterium]
MFTKNKNIIFPIVFVVVAIALISSFYFYSKYQQAQKLLNDPSQASKAETQELLTKVGNLIVLPSGETPTVATVSDKKKLANQAFFKNAENDDKVLIYSQAQKAILYRPSINKLIEVASVNLNMLNNQKSANKSISPTPTEAKAVILNGTARIGLTNLAETKLKEKISTLQVLDKDNASKNTYQKTLVSYSSDSQKAMAEQIAKILGGEVGPIPTGEKTVDSAILIILGKDFIPPVTPTPSLKP